MTPQPSKPPCLGPASRQAPTKTTRTWSRLARASFFLRGASPCAPFAPPAAAVFSEGSTLLSKANFAQLCTKLVRGNLFYFGDTVGEDGAEGRRACAVFLSRRRAAANLTSACGACVTGRCSSCSRRSQTTAALRVRLVCVFLSLSGGPRRQQVEAASRL
jgi:hypothetical protein